MRSLRITRSRGTRVLLVLVLGTVFLLASIAGLRYTNQVPEKRWIHDWIMLARHYRGNDTIIAADLANEPHGPATWGDGNPRTDWRLAAEEVRRRQDAEQLLAEARVYA